MLTIRPSHARGHFDHGWLDTRHTFSFGHYQDPAHMGFRSLRVINEDVVAPGQGFGAHPHRDMEIISYVVKGQLAHQDSLGHAETLGPGEVQRISAGTGVYHSEFNPSAKEPVHFLQIWLTPAKLKATPGYAQQNFGTNVASTGLRLVASPDGAEGSVTIGQDARVYAGTLKSDTRVSVALGAGRHGWVQVVRGKVAVNGTELGAGDGLAASDEASLEITTKGESELLVFDLA